RVAVDRGHVEAGELRYPQAAGVGELEERAVAHAQVAFGLRGDQPHRLVGRERLGQAPRRAGRLHARTGVRAGAILAREPVEEAAPAGERPRERARRAPAAVEARDEAAD